MIQVGDILHYVGDGYPDMKVVAIVDDAVALERADEIIEPLTWYSKTYIERLIDEAWSLNRPRVKV